MITSILTYNCENWTLNSSAEIMFIRPGAGVTMLKLKSIYKITDKIKQKIKKYDHITRMEAENFESFIKL